jgi:hypothetical protein
MNWAAFFLGYYSGLATVGLCLAVVWVTQPKHR